jgi:ketosteroid isomerase-like protein
MDDAESFVRRFAAFWARPSLEGMDALLHPDVVLVQPLAGTLRGLSRAKAEFARIFAAVPDLRGEVDRWCARDAAVFVELRLSGTLGRSRVEWPVVDRFLLEDGLAVERVSYFDPTRLLAAVAARPSSWPRLLRSGVWRGWLGL